MIRWNEETIYITGGAGLIGSHLAEELERRGAREIHIVDSLMRGSLDNLSRLKNFWLDETNLEIAKPRLSPGCILFHLAAKVAGIGYNSNNQAKMFSENVLINTHVMQSVVDARPKFFFNTSTACVYPPYADVPTAEHWADEFSPEPSNKGYGWGKLASEIHAQIIAEEFNIPTAICRFFNAVGPRDYYDDETSHVIPALIKRVLRGDPELLVFGTGKQDRVFVDARDIAHIICDLVEGHHDNPAVNCAKPINIGHEDIITIADLAKLVTNLCGVPDLPIYQDLSKPNGYEHRSCNHTLLDSLVGKHTFIPLETSIQDMIADYRTRYGVKQIDRITA